MQVKSLKQLSSSTLYRTRSATFSVTHDVQSSKDRSKVNEH